MALRADDVDLVRDRALVVRYQSGDGAAFDDLYRRYFSRLRRFCERRVGDPHEAEELAEEAFTKALRAMPDFAGERRFYPWMTVIASRLCVDSHRRRQRSTPVAEIDLGSVEPDLDELFAEVDRADLERALDRLAPRHREVLELRERDGWTYQRIAEHYDVTLGTVEALLHRARRALRREFVKLTRADHVGALAGVPGVAWVLRRLDSLRVRATQLGDYASPLSAAVASVAIAAGSVAMVGAGEGPPSRPEASVVTVGRDRAATAVAPVAPTTAAMPTATAAAGTVGAAGTLDSAPPARSVTPPARVDVMSADDARHRSTGAPVYQDVRGIGGVAVDPAAVVDDVMGRLDPLIRSLP
jgi:RNA polymerase sigma-70 factor (ECF subfamily)